MCVQFCFYLFANDSWHNDAVFLLNAFNQTFSKAHYFWVARNTSKEKAAQALLWLLNRGSWSLSLSTHLANTNGLQYLPVVHAWQTCECHWSLTSSVTQCFWNGDFSSKAVDLSLKNLWYSLLLFTATVYIIGPYIMDTITFGVEISKKQTKT